VNIFFQIPSKSINKQPDYRGITGQTAERDTVPPEGGICKQQVKPPHPVTTTGIFL
jgi:hypothetical protein